MDDSNIEELASRCLQRMQDEGKQVLEEICALHQEHADEIRGMVAQLIKLGLMEGPGCEDLHQVGDYRILRRLGGGGMGVVYLALQESLGRQVALKIMRPGFAVRAESKARFRREIEAISAIDHPGVCTVFEAGEADSVPYLAMRYVQGETLGQILKHRRKEKSEGKSTSSGGSQETMQLLGCAAKVARALHCAHEAGLVHRDVKPGNIMIDDHGEPVILDFGLVQDAGLDSQDLTASGDLLGTPPYMSPEQVEGKEVDRRSDVYSLAVTVYECLTLQNPFHGANRQAVYNKVLSEDPPDPRKANRTISKDLWVVLSKALEKDPRLRFSSALEFAEELRRIQEHQPILTVRTSLPVRLLRWTQRNHAAAAVLVSVTLAFLLSLWFLRRSQVAENRLRALSLSGEALALMDRDTTLAFKVAREAWRMDLKQPDPRVSSRLQIIIQRLMTELVPHKVLARCKTPYDRVLYSSRGNYILIMGRNQPGVLCTGDGERIPVDLPKAPTRAFPGAFSSDEKELAIADRTGVIHRFDLTTSPPSLIWQTKEPVHAFVWMVAYHDAPEGRRLLVCSTDTKEEKKKGVKEKGVGSQGQIEADEDLPNDNRVTIWTLGKGRSADVHRTGGLRWESAAWLPDGRFVGAGALRMADGTILEDLDSQEKVTPPVAMEAAMSTGKDGDKDGTGSPPESRVRRVIVSPSHFLVVTQMGILRVFDHDGNRVGTQDFGITKDMDKVTEAFFDPEDRSILITFQNGRVEHLEIDSWKLSPSDLETDPRRTVFTAAFTEKGRRITIGNWAGRIGIWNPDGMQVDGFLAHSNGITSLAYSPDEQHLVTASFGGVAKLWFLEKRAPQKVLRGLPWPHLAVSPDGSRLAILDKQGRLTLCDEEGKIQSLIGGAFESPDKGVTMVNFSPEGTRLLIHALGRRVRVLDLSGRSPVLIGPKSNYDSIARFLDTETVLVATLGSRQDLWTWKPETDQAQELYRLSEAQVHDRPMLTSGAVSSDGREIVIGDQRGGVFVMDRSGKMLWKNPTQVGLIRDVCFSKTARYVLAATEDGHAYLWDRRSGEAQNFGPQSSGVMKAIFSPDEKQVVVGYKSGRIRIWDRSSGRRVFEIAGHGGQQIHSLVYTRSGWLVSAGADNTVRWWWTDMDQLNQAVESVPVQQLDDAERRQFPDLFPK